MELEGMSSMYGSQLSNTLNPSSDDKALIFYSIPTLHLEHLNDPTDVS